MKIPHILTFLLCAALSPFASAQVGTWAFNYPPDGLRPGALLDLRSLNESVAGSHGFLQKTGDGRFVFADGTPARFWCVNAEYRLPMDKLRIQARFLAKLGVNMVRLHTAINPKIPGPITGVDENELDFIWRAVAANKSQGIYTTISPYWPNGGFLSEPDWNIPGYGPKKDMWGLLFFNPTLQEGYRAWVKALYTRPNPYTGIPLNRDPSVGIIEIQNEDSLLFWTFDSIAPPQKRLLGKMFGDWVIAKYGSFDRAFTVWQDASVPEDDLQAGVLAFMPMWKMGVQLPAGPDKRLDDQLQFMAETQRNFYASMEQYYRHDLGCPQLINACNWITADPVRLNDVERWTYTPTDVMAVNRYFNGGAHIGHFTGWRVDPGDFFEDQSALTHPRQMPTNLKQITGWPLIVTESSWVSPLQYQAEGPFLMAAYQSLTGVQGYYWFAVTAPEYANPYFDFLNIHGQHPMLKWTCSVPGIEGNFPAAALLYRMGYLQQGAPIVREGRTTDELFHRTLPAIAEDPTFDPNRNTGEKAGVSNVKGGVNPLAFLVGPVQETFGQQYLHLGSLGDYINDNEKSVRSDTGELAFDWGKGVCIMDAPKAQGVCGFLATAGGQWNLSTVSIRSDNDYASILIVSMDNLPLDQSRKILVQVGAMSHPTDWQTRPAVHKSADGKTTYVGKQIVNTGHLPWRIADTQVTLSIRNPLLKRAILLDPAGFPIDEIPASTGTSFTVTLPPDTLYAILAP
ncbi:MAG TPA: hypothetical protein VMD30_05160 [Tepidisphaeraceae bacterium]|nr:hypothetical protein [Tepidisphaeraceae bacterium]